jgi:phosphatidylserine/phosphatidylglycerophosphate/cardiolipin synthase-like enzyme
LTPEGPGALLSPLRFGESGLARDEASLYTNTSRRKDFFQNAFTEYSTTPCQVLIAVAFLTEPDPILKLAARGFRVKLIVRLGFPTSPDALRKLLGREGIQVKYINNRSFHPKLYIFSERAALVGSSNLTRSALLTNQEVNVSIPVTDPRYEELVATFVGYWDQVRVLEPKGVIDEYEKLYRKYESAHREVGRLETEVDALTVTRIDNINRGARPHDAQDDFLEDYRATMEAHVDVQAVRYRAPT